MKRFAFSKKLPAVAILLSLPLFMSCAGLKDLKAPSKPNVSFQGVKLAGLSLDSVDLLFDLRIDNPNAFGVSLAGFDYDMQLNQNSFLSGLQNDKQSIPANGSNTVQLPLTLTFSKIYQTFQSLNDADSTDYRLDLGFSFDLPILGVVKVPVSKAGRLPLLKLPKVSIGDIKLKKLNLTGADLQVNLNLENPNPFSATLNRLNYKISIDGKEFATGLTTDQIQINQKASNQIAIPVSLNFLKSGRTLYNLLTQNGSFDYTVTGDFDMSTSLTNLGSISMPFDRSGTLNITR
ncbi:MAG: LEA type 2 family protein [Deferribacteres bacterium]|nr:LEA type 2 family protein [Deferribacteres bacterium]